MSNMGAGLTDCDLLEDDSDDNNELEDDSSEKQPLRTDPTLHLQTPGGGGGQGDGHDVRGDDSKDSDDDLGDKGDDNDKLDHDSTRGHPGEGPANGEYAGKLMTWSAYVLDPRTKSSPPVEAPIPDDASIEQLRCHTRNAIENARASLTIATEDREKAKILTERLDKAVRETCPEASSSDTRQRTVDRRSEELKRRRSSLDTRQREVLWELQRAVDCEDMGIMGYHPSSRKDSEQLRIKKKHQLEFTMEVVQCTEEVAEEALRGMLHPIMTDLDQSLLMKGASGSVIGHARLLHQATTVHGALNDEPRKHAHCSCYFNCGCMYSFGEERYGQWQEAREAAAQEAENEVEAWRKAKIQHKLENWYYGEWKVKWKQEALKAEKAAAEVQRVATRAARIACAEATTDNVAAGQKAYAEALEELAAEEEAVAPMEFDIGQKVMFTGLTNPYGPAFNGKCGFIQAWNDEKQRFEVSITSTALIKASHLIPAVEATTADEPACTPISSTPEGIDYNEMPRIELLQIAKTEE